MKAVRRPVFVAAAAALVAVATLAAFAPALDGGFVAWDDRFYLVDNPFFRGLGWAQWRWAWTTARGGLYQPLTWLSFSLDHALWGLTPAGYHLTNLLLHAAAAVLFFFVCLRLFEAAGAGDERGRLYGAAFAALFFAVHPLRVESVAWATERKDVLCGALWLGAVLAYLHRRTKTAAALYGLSLAAKASGLALPLVLLVLDAYPLRRDVRSRPVLLEKAPFFALSLAAAAATSWSLRAGGDVVGLAARGLSWRVGQALYAAWFYPWKTVWPAALAPYHAPKAWFSRWSWQTAALAAATTAAGALLWRARAKRPAAAAAVAAYALLLLPAAGLVQNGLAYSAYERYGYLPCLSLCALAGGLLARAPRPAAVLAAAWLLVLGGLSRRQTRWWSGSLPLWARIAAANPGDAVAWENLGVAQAESGRLTEAASTLERAAAEDPAAGHVLEDLAGVYRRQGRGAEAERVLRRAAALKPRSADAYAALGQLLAQGSPRQAAQAIEPLERAVALGEPGAAVHDDLAAALARVGRAREAREQLEAALAADPGDGVARNDLGLAFAASGDGEGARRQFRAALRDPATRAQAHYNWGNLLLAEGRPAEAERHYREAARLAPGMAAVQVNWGNALARAGRPAEAVERYRQALKLEPRSAEARANLSAVGRLLRR